VRLGDETIRQVGYFRFNNASLSRPHRTLVGNEKLIEIDSRWWSGPEYPPEYFDYPLDAKIDNRLPGVPSRLRG